MDWSQQTYLTAGLGALALGAGALVREPRRARSRYFALLCASLAVWTLGIFARGVAGKPDFPWQVVFLFGSCSAAAVGLHFCVVVARETGALRRVALPLAYAACSALWVSSWTPYYRIRPLWNVTALAVLGGTLLVALGVLARSARALPPGSERRAHRLLMAGGLIGVAGGLSDFIPRDGMDLPRIGPAATLLFLVVVCSVVVRHRFLDVDAFLIRAVILVAGAAAGGLVIFAVAQWSEVRYFPIFVATLVVLSIAATLGRAVMSGARSLVQPRDPLARALVDVSRALAAAVDGPGVWAAIERGRATLPGDVHLHVVLRDDRGDYRGVHQAGGAAEVAPAAADDALPRLLRLERLPLTRDFLERERLEAPGERRALAPAALERLRALDARLVVPLLDGDRLRGWIAIGGGLAERYVTAEVAAALMAVGNQASASLDRIDAVELAKRREALAAVGEMAAGLAHEVRNPVAAIRGAAQAIRPGTTPGQAQEMLEVIEEETGRLGRVVGDFLDYARPDSSRREPVRLDELARRALRAAELAGFGLRSEIVVEPSAPPALGDPEQLRRAFENLIRNAHEAAGPQGALRIEVAREGRARVAVRFEDNGPGLPEEQVAQVLRPFRSGRPGGTGLGLALVHRIVETHGGEIRVEGRPGRGAAFTLVLPAAGTVPAAAPDEEQPATRL